MGVNGYVWGSGGRSRLASRGREGRAAEARWGGLANRYLWGGGGGGAGGPPGGGGGGQQRRGGEGWPVTACKSLNGGAEQGTACRQPPRPCLAPMDSSAAVAELLLECHPSTAHLGSRQLLQCGVEHGLQGSLVRLLPRVRLRQWRAVGAHSLGAIAVQQSWLDGAGSREQRPCAFRQSSPALLSRAAYAHD